MTIQQIDVLIIGAGAAGLFCGIEAGKRHRKVIIIDHANKPGKKILMSGGGRCNFTNYTISSEKYISQNRHFCKSALKRYTQWDFIQLVEKHGITYHEKTDGQLFCDNKSKEILDMLLRECENANVGIHLNTPVITLQRLHDYAYKVSTTRGIFHCQSLVIATGGLSIPTMGSSPLGYKVAKQFNINVQPTRAGLVPFTLHNEHKQLLSSLSGIAVESTVTTTQQFFGNILFTHRGLSGPAILQISSYWCPGEELIINLMPKHNITTLLKSAQHFHPHKQLKNILNEFLPRRLVDIICNKTKDTPLAQLTHESIEHIAAHIHHWKIKPNGTEGYRTAEVTLGGVDVNAISSKTMESLTVPGLYFIGEVLDVTGWLGGYNFQWAWSSGWAAGQVV